MPIGPEEFIGIASALQFGRLVPKGEACHRTVAGRAYYSAFLALREEVRKALKSPTWDPGHTPFITALKDMPSPTSMVGESLDELFDYRVTADYDLQGSLDTRTAGSAINTAEQIVRNAPRIAKSFDLLALKRLPPK